MRRGRKLRKGPSDAAGGLLNNALGTAALEVGTVTVTPLLATFTRCAAADDMTWTETPTSTAVGAGQICLDAELAIDRTRGSLRLGGQKGHRQNVHPLAIVGRFALKAPVARMYGKNTERACLEGPDCG